MKQKEKVRKIYDGTIIARVGKRDRNDFVREIDRRSRAIGARLLMSSELRLLIKCYNAGLDPAQWLEEGEQ